MKLGMILKHFSVTNGDEIVLFSCFARIFKVHYCVILA